MNIFGGVFTFILVYGYPAIAIATFLSAVGVPLPGLAIALVAGSLAATGNHNLVLLFVLVTCANLAGDMVDYFLGLWIGEAILEKFAKHSSVVRRYSLKIRHSFVKWSAVSIFLTRWLLPPLAPTVSVLSGLSEYPLRRFVMFAFMGEVVSSIIFLSIGYLFSVNGLPLLATLTASSGVGIGVVGGVILLVIGFSLQK